MKLLIKLLATYAYNSPREFFESMFPSWKYQLQYLSLLLSGISGALSYLFGFGPALALAMFAAVVIEVWTGIKASRKTGRHFVLALRPEISLLGRTILYHPPVRE